MLHLFPLAHHCQTVEYKHKNFLLVCDNKSIGYHQSVIRHRLFNRQQNTTSQIFFVQNTLVLVKASCRPRKFIMNLLPVALTPRTKTRNKMFVSKTSNHLCCSKNFLENLIPPNYNRTLHILKTDSLSHQNRSSLYTKSPMLSRSNAF